MTGRIITKATPIPNTVKKLVNNEEIMALFDAQDSIPGSTKAATIKINGRKSALILIVVGADERKIILIGKKIWLLPRRYTSKAANVQV